MSRYTGFKSKPFLSYFIWDHNTFVPDISREDAAQKQVFDGYFVDVIVSGIMSRSVFWNR